MNIRFNGTDLWISSVEALSGILDGYIHEPQFELWISMPDEGAALSMLRNGDQAWLMYLSFHGDRGVVTKGDQSKQGTYTYTLSNGQIDEYPLSWCIDLKQCYEAFAYFFVNDGARYDGVEWQIA
jgi:hypothetical protein